MQAIIDVEIVVRIVVFPSRMALLQPSCCGRINVPR
jgi:hypothetical protein